MTDPLLSLALLAETAVIGVWLWQHVEIGRIHREGLRVPSVEADDQTSDCPPLTVIVPARNEAGRIKECIESVLGESIASMQVIVADDRSEDDTAGAVRAAAGGDRRVCLYRIDALPPGWLGKSHALWSAAQTATTEWLLFLDADCRILPGGLRSALRYALDRRLDFLSLWPRDGSVGFWERVLIPLCGAMIVIWYGSRRINDPRFADAFANGQFILVRRDAYLAMGGHAAVRDALIEDIPLARRAKASGLHTHAALGTDIYSVRMYGSLLEVVRGWRRIYVGVLRNHQIVLCVGSILAGSLLPFGLIGACLGPVVRGAGGWWTVWLIAGLVHLVALVLASLRFFGLARCRLDYLLFYPLSCAGVLAILAAALVQRVRGGAVTWRGTEYRVDTSTIRPDK
ncbi:MAG: glycosyltransferase [Phycisphaerae bacterium]